MSEAKRIKTALVSVYHKEGLDEIITKTTRRRSRVPVNRRYKTVYRIFRFPLQSGGGSYYLSLYFGRTCEDTAS